MLQINLTTSGALNDGSGSGTYVAWNFRAGGSSNTFNVDGTGYSSASAAGLATGTDTPTGASVSTASGFSVIKLTSANVANSNRTVAHGLGVKPSFVLFRRRVASGWFAWSAGLSTESYYLYLQENFGIGDLTQNASIWGNQSFTSQHISWRNSYTFSPNEELIAYVWADVSGYQKSGSYVGTGVSGKSENVGFEPSFLMIKRTNSASGWRMLDNKRFSGSNKSSLEAQSSNSEQVGYIDVDFNSTNFTINSTNADFNANGGTYIYLAIA